MLTPALRQRYGRQLQLPQIGDAGQERLMAARVMVVGIGGLGSPVSMYLASAGVGRLVLVDYDRVELSNLQRQIAHGTADVDRLKVDSAANTLAALNPEVAVEAIPRALEGDELLDQVRGCQVVVDASDNFETRFGLNAACIAAKVPLVSGAAMRWEGQVTVLDGAREDSPCFRCIYPDDGSPGETCERVGVIAPLLGIVGSLQAVEVIKLLAGVGESLVGRLLLVDALHQDIRTVRLRKDPACPVCGKR